MKGQPAVSAQKTIRVRRTKRGITVGGFLLAAVFIAGCSEGNDTIPATTTAGATADLPQKTTSTRTVTVTGAPTDTELTGTPAPPSENAVPAEPAVEESTGNSGSAFVGKWYRHGAHAYFNADGTGEVGLSNGAMNSSKWKMTWSGSDTAVSILVGENTEHVGELGTYTYGEGQQVTGTVNGNQLLISGMDPSGRPLELCRDTGDYSNWQCGA